MHSLSFLKKNQLRFSSSLGGMGRHRSIKRLLCDRRETLSFSTSVEQPKTRQGPARRTNKLHFTFA